MPARRFAAMATQALDTPELYRITVRGMLDERWSAWLDGLAVVAQEDGKTVLIGTVAGQPGLHRLLNKIRDLGLHLLSVEQVRIEQ